MSYANPNIKAMKSYTPPLKGRRKFNGYLLDFNERTISPNNKVRKALADYMKTGRLEIYPEYGDLTKRIGDYAEVQSNQVMITNGSDQGIDLIFRTFTSKDDEVIIPSPSFAMFYQCAEIMENKIITPKYKDDGNFPSDEILKSITDKTKLIVICNPNNPTGTLIGISEIEMIAKRAPKAIVYIDEAYFEFSQVTATGLINKYPNVVITRTFSKAFGLPSLRIGYVISNKQLINEILKVRGPYDISMPAYIGATESLRDLQDLKGYVREVMKGSKPMVEEYFNQEMIEYLPSGGNFILFKSNKKIAKTLDEKGYRLRPQKNNWLRLSIGTISQMESLLKTFNQISS